MRGGCLLLVLATLGLQGCSQPDSRAPAPSTAVVPSYVAMARGTVDVEGGLLNVSTARDGVFTSVAVKPGQQVHRGDLLGQLDDRAVSLDVGMAEAEVQHATAELAALTVRQPATQQTMQRWQEAARLGAAEQQQADAASAASAQLQADIAVARAGVELARQKELQARHELVLRKILAPVDAEIIKVLVQPGSTVSLQDREPSFVLLPQRPLVVRAEVNESYVARIQSGHAAEVTLEADPSLAPIKARVVRVGRVLEAGRLSEAPQMAHDFECILELQDNPATMAQKLRIGQTVLVKFND